MLLLPVGQVQHWLNFPSQLAYVLERPDEFAPDVALRGDSVPEAALHETASILGLRRYRGKPRIGHRMPAPARKAPFTYLVNLDVRRWLTFARSYGELTDVDVQLFRDKTTIRFTSPVTFHPPGAKALVRLSGAALAGLPRRSAVADLIQSGATWRDNALQLTAWAVNEYSFELHIPELPEVASALLVRQHQFGF
jgi:hypothetical protein